MKLKKLGTIALIVLTLLVLSACTSDTQQTDAVNTTEASTSSTEIEEATEATSNPDRIIVIKDPELEKIIREQIGKPEGDITALDMEMVYSINIDFKEYPVYEIDGLEYAVNLNDFSFRYGNLKSLDAVAELKNITYLTISYSTLEQMPPVFDTPLLSRINFIETNVSDMTFLSNVPVESASLVRSGITSIDFLNGWDMLVDINLSDNAITDVTPLEGKIKLVDLNLHKNMVEDISVFESLTSLELLNISYNKISNISPIMQLKNLKELIAYEELDKKIIDRGMLNALIDKGVLVEYHK